MIDEKIIKDLKNNFEAIKPFIGRLMNVRERQMVQEAINNIEEDLIIVQQPINKVTDLIDDMGLPARLKGYNYVRDAIVMLIEDDESDRKSMAWLYPEVANRHGTTWRGVEGAINRVIESAWNEQDGPEKIKNILKGSIESEKKPSAKVFILAVANRIQLNSI